jgi:hypothetical protein
MAVGPAPSSVLGQLTVIDGVALHSAPDFDVAYDRLPGVLT